MSVVVGTGLQTRRDGVLPAEGVVDIDDDLLLAFGQALVGEDRGHQVLAALPLLQDPGLHIQDFRRDAQGLGDLLENLGRRLTQAALDLAQVRIAHPGLLGQLPQRDLGAAPLVPNEVAEISHVESRHGSVVDLPSAKQRSVNTVTIRPDANSGKRADARV